MKCDEEHASHAFWTSGCGIPAFEVWSLLAGGRAQVRMQAEVAVVSFCAILAVQTSHYVKLLWSI